MHHTGLCVAVAALLPFPAAMSGSDAQSDAQSVSNWAVASADNPPVVDVAPELSPTVSTSDGLVLDQSERRQLTHKKQAVISKTRHERVLEISDNTSYDVPLAALQAYREAAASTDASDPGCRLSWGVIAAIGQVESNHGRFGGAAVLSNGVTSPRIVGLPLNGDGVASIPDTDNGRFDGDKVWDRAVGPMQFIPSTWVGLGLDGDGDGQRNPSDFDDAALSTAHYLCSGGADMTVLAQARSAVLRYNHSDEYVDLVLSIANVYDSGVVDIVPNDTAPPAQPKRHRPHHKPKHDDGNRHPDNPRQHRPGGQGPDSKPPSKPHHDDPADPKPHHPQPPKSPKPPKPPTPPEPPVLTYHHLAFYLGTIKLNLGATTVLASVQADYNGNGVDCETVRVELNSLVGQPITVRSGTDGVVNRINSLPYSATAVAAPCGSPSPSPPTGSAPAPAPKTPPTPSVPSPTAPVEPTSPPT